MNPQLIPVFAGELSGVPVQLLDARLWHSFLDVATQFKDWIARRIEEYVFIDGQDFRSFLSKTKGRPSNEYHLSIDMAKELGMIERNEKGRQIRRFFLEMERQSQLLSNIEQLPEPPTITKAQQGDLFTMVANKARSSGKPNAYFWSRYQNHFKL